jgi:alpha-glucosidase
MTKMSYRKRISLLFTLFLIAAAAIRVNAQTINSPDNNTVVNINVGKEITYDISFKGKEVAKGNTISMTLSDGKVLGADSKLTKKLQRSVDEEVAPLYGMASVYEDKYNELTLQFKEKFSIVFRVYNTGVAYRFETRFPGTIRIKEEQAEFNFTNATKAWFQSGKGHGSFYEEPHLYEDFSNLTAGVLKLVCWIIQECF